MENELPLGKRVANAVIAAIVISAIALFVIGGTILGVYLAQSIIGAIGGLLGFGTGVGISHAIARAAG